MVGLYKANTQRSRLEEKGGKERGERKRMEMIENGLQKKGRTK